MNETFKIIKVPATKGYCFSLQGKYCEYFSGSSGDCVKEGFCPTCSNENIVYIKELIND